MTRFRCFLIGVLLPAALDAQSPTKRGITPEDYFSFEFASDPRISPDGSQAVYVVSRVDRAQNRRMPSVWIVPTDGSAQPRELVAESWSPSAPRFLPDGKSVSFISSLTPEDTGTTAARRPAVAPARAQLWVQPIAGGAPRRVSSVRNGVSNCTWASDGVRAACLSRTGPSDNWPEGKERSDVRHYTRISYKFNDAGWFDDRRSHLWVVDTRAGSARQITEGDDWNDTDPQWSPDGTRIAFVSNRTGKEPDQNRNSDVWIIPAGGGELTKVSASEGPDNSPRWSPEGTSIAFISGASGDNPPRLMLAPSDGGTPIDIAPNFDMLPTDLQWARDAEGTPALYFGSGVRGEYHVYMLRPEGKRIFPIRSGPRAVRSTSVSNAGRMVYLVNDFQHLDDVFSLDFRSQDGMRERKLSSLNAALWQQISLMPVERFTYRGADGWDIDGFLVKPLGFDPNRKYPMVLSIHGGPAGMYGVDWFHEFQAYSAKGWAVFYPNPRGSTGYGRKFQRGIVNEWGGKDYVDVMNGVFATLARNPWIDSTRLGVTGGSYGGYLTNWIVGHTNLFKAAVTLRGISNFISDEGTRDDAYGHRGDFSGDLFQRFDFYWERSPLKYVKNVQTPILILHQDNDFRVPIEQGEQWFRGLRHFGKIAEIVFFPRENHNMTRTGEPKHLVESLKWQHYWFDKYVEGKKDAVPPNALPATSATQTSALKAFTGLALIDGTDRPPLANATIIVRDGRVVAAGPASTVTIPQGAERIALDGKFVIPGLINAHGHVNAMRDLRTYAAYGVTTVFSLGSEPPEVFASRAEQSNPTLERARVFVSGPVLTPRSPEEARAQVADIAARKADILKIRVDDNLGTTQKMAPEIYRVVIDEAHRLGLRVAAHLFYLADAKSLLAAKADLIAHSVRDADVDADLISALKASGVCYVPTLMREVSTFVYESTPEFFSDSMFLAHANPAWVAMGRDTARQRATRASPAAQRYKAALEVASRNVKRLADVGVLIAMGTDTGPTGRFQGYFELMELELMARAGLTPKQVLASATRDAARCMKVDRDVGTLEPGKWADFVVLDANPLSNISNVRRISSVWIAGNRVPR